MLTKREIDNLERLIHKLEQWAQDASNDPPDAVDRAYARDVERAKVSIEKLRGSKRAVRTSQAGEGGES